MGTKRTGSKDEDKLQYRLGSIAWFQNGESKQMLFQSFSMRRPGNFFSDLHLKYTWDLLAAQFGYSRVLVGCAQLDGWRGQ
jgi:hypothetical protein